MASNRWDSLLSDSSWYVPAANLLAYRLDSSSPDTPIPAADQTIWSIGKAIGRPVQRPVGGQDRGRHRHREPGF